MMMKMMMMNWHPGWFATYDGSTTDILAQVDEMMYLLSKV